MSAFRLLRPLLALLAAGVFSSSLSAATEIRFSSAFPDNNTGSDAMKFIKKRMEEKFPNDVTVSVHLASALFRQGTEIPAMQRGNLEMATPIIFEVEAQMPEYGVLGSAYLFRSPEHMINVFRGDIGKEFYKDVAEKMDIILLDAAYMGTRQVNLRTEKPVMKPADMAGLKMRMPPGPTYQLLMKVMGATPLSMPATEMYLGLKTGSVDGQDNSTILTRDWKLHEVTKQVVLTRHLVQPVFFAVAKQFFEKKLTPPQQEALRAAAREAADIMSQATIKGEKEALDEFTKAGLKITTPDVAAFREAVNQEYQKSGIPAKWKKGLKERIEAVK